MSMDSSQLNNIPNIVPDPIVPTNGSQQTNGTQQTKAQNTLTNFNQTKQQQQKQPSLGGPTSLKKKSPTTEETKTEPDLIPGNNNEPSAIDQANNAIAKFSFNKGLGLAFFVLIFLIWLLVPTASGYTRIQLLWFTLLGETKLTTDKSVNAPTSDTNPGNQVTTVSTPNTTPSTVNSTVTVNANGNIVQSSGPDLVQTLPIYGTELDDYGDY